MKPRITFAIPGDIDTLSGGYLYEKNLLLALREIGWDVTHLPLPGGFPEPTAQTIETCAQTLAQLPDDTLVLLDGFLPGALPPDRLAALDAPFVAITHHPLGYETGLSAERAAELVTIERKNLSRASHVIVPSPHTAEVLVSDFAVSRAVVTIAAPGVAKRKVFLSEKAKPAEVLSVGQLVPRKGYDILLSSLAQISDLDWHATIIGKAPDKGYARELAEMTTSLGIASRVLFAGTQAPERLARDYARATVFALATRYEGYGMVFAEALQHGLPIITCDAGAVPQTVPLDAGVLVSPDDADAFAGALRRLLTDTSHRNALSAASATHGRNLPSWQDTARIVGDVLSRLAP